MDFTKIRLSGLSYVDLPIVGALPSDQFILTGAEGLGPPEMAVSIADTLNADGYYQGRTTHRREIVLDVGLNPDYQNGGKASDLRTTLYGLLTPKIDDSISVQIRDDSSLLVYTTGYVSKLETMLFSKDPAVQITIPCLQRYWVVPELLYISPASLADPVITNLGTAPAGFHMEVVFTSNTTNWSIYGYRGEMEITYSFLIGDKLTIDTRPGSRGIWLTRSGITTNIIYTLSSTSTWIILYGGNNDLHTSSQNFTWGDVYYLPQYWGV